MDRRWRSSTWTRERAPRSSRSYAGFPTCSRSARSSFDPYPLASCESDPMSNVVIVGAQWGDEGKGKIVDLFTSWADVVVRYQGGANAGHTLVVGGTKTVLHLVPSG